MNVPAGWSRITLGGNVEIYSGVAPAQAKPCTDGNIPYVKVEDLNNSTKYQISARQFTARAKGIVPSGSVLFPKRGGAILTNKLRLSRVELMMDTNLMALHPSSQIEAEFLFYALSHAGLSKLADTSTIPQINNKHIIPFRLWLPPLPEQRKIAEILRTWDDAIERVELKRSRSLQRRTGLIQKLIFGHGRPHGVIWHQTAPDWDIRSIGEVASEVSSRNARLAATDVLTCSKHRGFVRSADYFARTVHSADLSNYKIIRRGQFGFPSNHIEEGSIGLQNVVDVGAVSPIYTVFEFDRSLIDGDFAYLVVKTRAYVHMFDVSTSSSVDRRGSLRWPEFSKLPFPVPPLDEQRRIVGIASDADREIELLQRKAELLRAQKRGLMQKLLTGQLRVNVAAEIRPGGPDDH